MRINYAEEKLLAFKLLTDYTAFNEIILTNYPFKEDWIKAYRERYRRSNLQEFKCWISLNENLQWDWIKAYDEWRYLIDFNAIKFNKTACTILQQVDIPIYYTEQKEDEIDLISFDSSFGVEDLTQLLSGEFKGFNGRNSIFGSKRVWTHFFKEFVDEEMIQAWEYHDYLKQEVEYHYANERECKEDEMMSRYYESQEMAQYEEAPYDEDNVIDTAFEGDRDNIWNVD